MNRIKLLLPALLLLAVACKHKPKEPAGDTTEPKDSAVNSGYLPVADFIKNDIIRVDSFAGGILKRANRNGKKDSVYIQIPEFKKLASQFLIPELDSASFSQHMSESSLMDNTTEMLNFIYLPKQADWPLRKVMIYLTPSLADDKVDRIYIEKEFTRGDTSFHQKLNWKIQEYFYTITIQQPNNGPAVTTMEKVIWDPQHFAEE
jgi:hypothetical protein